MFPNFQKRQVCFAKEPLKIDHVTAYRHMAGGMLKWNLLEKLGLRNHGYQLVVYSLAQ